MATILEFRVEARSKSTKKPARRKRRSAEVVIFPGVRMEHGRAGGEMTGSKPGTPRRDVLKLLGQQGPVETETR
jgi:hypothetical protein